MSDPRTVAACAHPRDAIEHGHDPFVFRCTACGAALCTDCGSTPAHEDSPCQYCRRCAEKGGHRCAFFTEIDHDKLRALVGRETAAKIIEECRYD